MSESERTGMLRTELRRLGWLLHLTLHFDVGSASVEQTLESALVGLADWRLILSICLVAPCPARQATSVEFPKIGH